MRADRVAVRRDRSFEPAAEALAGGARTLAAIAALTLAACSVESADGGPDAGDAPADGYFTSEDVNTVFIEEMTWTEVRDAIDRGATTVILPTAGTEQNGPHMVTGKHRYIIEEASDRIARELGDALVAPTVTYVPEGGVDPPSGHMRYAGTITLPNEFFMKLVEYAARSFRAPRVHRHRVHRRQRRATSGGWRRSRHDAERGVGRRGIATVHFIGDYYANNGFRDWLVEQGEVPMSRSGGHAGISDTSILLYVEPAAHPPGRAGAGRRVRGERRVGGSDAGFGRVWRGRDADAGGRGRSADYGREGFG